jgi:hypothetical protein
MDSILPINSAFLSDSIREIYDPGLRVKVVEHVVMGISGGGTLAEG